MESKVGKLCRNKEQELLDKYFPKSGGDVMSQTIGEYTKDLPLRIEAEFKDFLTGLWKEHSGAPLVLEEQKLRELVTKNDREAIDAAYKDAKRITLWERITKTNHEDVNHYKGLLYQYTKELLTVMRLDFLEEITGHHLTGKAFED